MATNFNMALGFYSSFCTTSLVTASITFYVEYRKSDICCFRATTLSPYSEFETSQFLPIIFAVLLSKLFVEFSTKLRSCNCIIFEKKDIPCSGRFSQRYNVVKMTAVSSLEFSKFVFYVTWPLSPCHAAPPCKIAMKSDNWLPNYGQKNYFQYGGHPPSWI